MEVPNQRREAFETIMNKNKYEKEKKNRGKRNVFVERTSKGAVDWELREGTRKLEGKMGTGEIGKKIHESYGAE